MSSWAVSPDDLQDRDRVELTLPARPELLFLVRMTAAAVASRADFGYDQIEDLRLAIDELALGMTGDGGSPGRLQLLFSWTGDAVEVVGVYQPGDDEPRRGDLVVAQPENELSARILDALVDEHGRDVVNGCPRVWLRMRRRSVGRQAT